MELDDFSWGGTQESVEFFGERVEPQIDEALTPPVKETEEEQPQGANAPEQEEEEVITFFGEEPETLDLEDDEEEKPRETKPKKQKVDNYYNSLFLDLKDKGFYENVELEEGQELTAEDLLDLQEQEIENRLNRWGEENLGQIGVDFIKYLRHGGDPSQFLQMQQQNGQYPQGDINDPNFQEHVVRFTLANEGWDSEEIEERIAVLENTGKLSTVAGKYNAKLEAKRKEANEALIAKQKEKAERQKQEFKEYTNSLAQVAKSKNEIGGFRITPSRANKLIADITKPTVELEDGRVVSKFQNDINQILKDPEKTLLLAHLADNNFDFSQLQRQANNKAAKEIKRNIQNHGVSTSSGPGSSLGGLQTLADLLE